MEHMTNDWWPKFSKGEYERRYAALRGAMVEQGGHVLPLRLVARNVLRGTRTEITVSDLVVNPPLDERLFTLKTLESQRPLR